MNAQIKSIPHKEHRYPTVGDYWLDENGVTQFRVSDMANEDYHFLVAIHEMVEEHLTRRCGIHEADIKAFDEAFEAKRAEGNENEPGDDPAAPYRKEHRFAENIERQIALEIGVDWAEYSRVVNACE
jgi:hypothetical protein